ncbi:hypothetical protein [Nocardioides marmoraquaticus]
MELLLVPDCPHAGTASEMVQAVLDELGVQGRVITTVVSSDAQAEARGFVGSPTFLLDGQDPFAEPGSSVGLTCRMYRTPAGLGGVPTLSALREAVRGAATP